MLSLVLLVPACSAPAGQSEDVPSPPRAAATDGDLTEAGLLG